ncbi:MAG: hypothetical protein AAGA93_27995 [Actinomycetota bacterium]
MAPEAVGGERRAWPDAADRRQLLASDTVFLASDHVDHGVDPTHCGGPAGFVAVLDDTACSRRSAI